ncbi:MAG: hypothetical protein HYZ09_03450 [Candidatus Kerfeldbacteria bacterium]|nr:hypothetical protein [Candidatus Kerfeldbacteria bacterium]
MQLFGSLQHKAARHILGIVVGLAYAVGLLVLLFNIQGRVTIESTDAFTYADTARQIAHGEGFTTRVIQPEVAAVQMPQTTWPPFFPLLIAVPLFFGVDLGQALMGTSQVFLALSSGIFAWYVVRRWGLLPAVFWAAFSLTAAPMLHVASQPMTEALFMGLSLLVAVATFELLERREGESGRRGVIVLAVLLGLLLAAVGWTRYLGFALAPGVFLALLVFRRFTPLVVTVLTFVLTSVPLLFRNFVLHREFTNERFPTDQSFFLNVRDAIVNLIADGRHHLLWPVILAVGAVAVLAIAIKLKQPLGERYRQRELLFGALLGWLGIVYLAGMVVARSFVFFDRLVTRFIVPVEWLLVAAVSLGAAALIARTRWLAWAVAVVVAAFGIRFVPHLHEPPTEPRLPISGVNIAWAASNTESDSLILSNHAHAYNFFLGRTVVALRAHREPESVNELLAWKERWGNTFSNVYLVLQRKLSGERHTQFIVDLSFERNIPDALEHLEGTPTRLEVYRIR